MPQLLLQRLPCRDCAGERAWGWRGGEGSLYWCARVLGCRQPKSRHLGKVRSERFHMKVQCPELPPPSSLGHLLPPLVQTLCRLCQSSLEHVEGLEGVHVSKQRLKQLNFMVMDWPCSYTTEPGGPGMPGRPRFPRLKCKKMELMMKTCSKRLQLECDFSHLPRSPFGPLSAVRLSFGGGPGSPGKPGGPTIPESPFLPLSPGRPRSPLDPCLIIPTAPSPSPGPPGPMLTSPGGPGSPLLPFEDNL